mgnify:FL=1
MEIAGIVIKHGNNDFEYWTGFSFTKDEENVIWNILNKHDIEGCSVRGTRKEIIKEVGEW